MFLSRIELQPGNLAVTRDLGDVGELHRTVMRAFPQVASPNPRSELGVLFRAEFRDTQLLLLVQSLGAPDWTQLPVGYLKSVQCKDISANLEAVSEGHVLRFLLVANPTRKSSAPRPGEVPPRNSRRFALTTDEERHRWLAARAARNGFAIDGTGPHDGVRIDVLPGGRPPVGRRATCIVARAVRFEGRLRVTDADVLREAVTTGIGPAKAYGCGLLSLAPG